MIRRPLKIAGLILAGALIVAQFFQPEKNLNTGPQEHDILGFMEIPDQVVSLLKNSCYDCHSNNTRYPWYDKISPVSWYLDKHVKDGKQALNFNEFGLLNQRKMIGTLSTVCEVIESGSMPLVSYTIIHRSAGLDEEEARILCDWAEAGAEQLMKAAAKPANVQP
jgi:hypothetical protein